ncbi:MAG: hypothetical protein K6B40_07475 [Firmicutes bacterium]|nr:hypothetical protein [Bacillota bacterium]
MEKNSSGKTFMLFPLLQAAVLLGLLLLDQALRGQSGFSVVIQVLLGFCLAFPHWQSWFSEKGKMRLSLPSLIAALALAAAALGVALSYAAMYAPWGVSIFTSRFGFSFIWLFIGYLLPWAWRRQEETGAVPHGRRQWLGLPLVLALIIGFMLIDRYAFPIARQQLQGQLFEQILPYFSTYNVLILAALGLVLAFVHWRHWFDRRGRIRFSWAGLAVVLFLSALLICLLPTNAIGFLRHGWALLWLLWGYFLPAVAVQDIHAAPLSHGEQKIRRQAGRLILRGTIATLAVLAVIYAAALFAIAHNQRDILSRQTGGNAEQILYEEDLRFTGEKRVAEKLIITDMGDVRFSFYTPHYMPLSFGKVCYYTLDSQYCLTLEPQAQKGSYQIVGYRGEQSVDMLYRDFGEEGAFFTREVSSRQQRQILHLGMAFDENDLGFLPNLSFRHPLQQEDGATAWLFVAQPLP